MKIIEREKVVKEVIWYEAEDGNRFISEAECKKYEESALFAAGKAFRSLSRETDYRENYHDLFPIGYEDSVYIADIRDANALQIVNTYIVSSSKYCSTVDPKYIGNKVMIAQCDDEHYTVGTKQEMKIRFEAWLDKMFGKDDENEEV